MFDTWSIFFHKICDDPERMNNKEMFELESLVGDIVIYDLHLIKMETSKKRKFVKTKKSVRAYATLYCHFATLKHILKELVCPLVKENTHLKKKYASHFLSPKIHQQKIKIIKKKFANTRGCILNIAPFYFIQLL